MQNISPKILHLSLKKPQFDVTVSREKTSEFRRPSNWILSRIKQGKTYDLIKFTNGYGSNKPSFICIYLGWKTAKSASYIYSNGLVVNVDENYIEFELGEIVEIKNYQII